MRNFLFFFISRSEEDFLDYEDGGLRLEAVAFSAQTAPKITGGGPPPLPTGGIDVQAALTPSAHYSFSLLDAIYVHLMVLGIHSIQSIHSRATDAETFFISSTIPVPAGFSDLGFSDHYRFSNQKLGVFGRPIIAPWV